MLMPDDRFRTSLRLCRIVRACVGCDEETKNDKSKVNTDNPITISFLMLAALPTWQCFPKE